jgi:hypothetical protein
LAFLGENLAVVYDAPASIVPGTRTMAMKSDSNREVCIFTEALKVALQERDEFLANACGADKKLRRKVEALLRAHGRIGNFLEEPPTGGPTE